MTRSTLRYAAGFLLAAILLLPVGAAAGERPRGRGGTSPAGPGSFLAGVWSSLVRLLPGEWRMVTALNQGDNGWQIDPNGGNAPTRTNDDNGWLIDPDG